MRSFTVAAAFAALAVANPLPQEIDWAAVDALTPIPTITIPVVDVSAQASTVSYEPSAAATSVAAEVNASGVSSASAGLKARAAVTCKPQPTGAGPVPTPDTPEAFLAYSDFSATADSAKTPSGYYNTFTNLQASNNAYGYMGYTVLSEYSAQTCADKCDAIKGCAAFNIYFERDPTVNPNDASCANPSSTTNIKCVFWGGPVTTENAKNNGQWRKDFHVVIAGSNGYVSDKIVTPPGCSTPIYLGDAAINAPFDCNGNDTYLGVRIFQSGPFDISKCAAACTAQADYARAHPPSNGGAIKTCQFYNTYMLMKNGEPVGQYCALYDHSWPQSYATNFGQYRGSDKYTIEWSYISSNATNAAPACQPKA
ncbi:glycoside hydrolase, partial [Aureobasidium melanogenum]